MEPEKKRLGRKPKMSDADKETARKRLIAGEKAAVIARDYGVDDKVIRRLKSEKAKDPDGELRHPVEDIKRAAEKSLANDMGDPEVRNLLEVLGTKDRDLFYAHKNALLEVTMQLSLASKFSAQNAHKLAMLAQNHLAKVDVDAVIDGEARTAIDTAMMLQAASNESAKQPMKLFEIATKQPPPPAEDQALRIVGGLPAKPYD